MSKRNRRVGSIKSELLKKSREAALAAVQIFNNSNISFKSESYVVLMIIFWTYLVHTYYRDKKIEYRYFEQRGKRRKFDKTKHGAQKYWELERCLNDANSPLDKDTANRKGQADRIIEFVKSDSPLAKTVNKEYAVIKETEKKKYLPKQIVDLMNKEGFPRFSIHYHTQLWKSLDAKNPARGYGTVVAGQSWLWYERWLDAVHEHCQKHKEQYS